MHKYETETIWGIIGVSIVGMFFLHGCAAKQCATKEELNRFLDAQSKFNVKVVTTVDSHSKRIDEINKNASNNQMIQVSILERLLKLEEFNAEHEKRWPKEKIKK